MAYTKDNFQEWIYNIADKMDYFTETFATENGFTADYSTNSLDDLENWIILSFPDRFKLIENGKVLDLLTIYIGEVFRKKIGGKWFMDLENKENAYYQLPVLKSNSYKGEKYISPLTFATACISRKRGNYISSILKNSMREMDIKE